MMGLGISQPVVLLRYTHLSLGDLRDIRSREHPAAESTELYLSSPSCTFLRADPTSSSSARDSAHPGPAQTV